MFLRIEPSSGVPIIRQIADQIRTQCATGQLKPGDRLPSVRELAAQLAVNQNTILRVYERLTAEDIIDRRHGDGTYVADHLPAGGLQAQRELLRAELRHVVERALAMGLSDEDLHQQLDAVLAAVQKKKETVR